MSTISHTLQIIVAWLILITVARAESGHLVTVNFDDMDADLPPKGFFSTLTGEGGPVDWVVESQDSGNVNSKALVQKSNEKTSYRFPLCIYGDFTGKDVDLTVRFRPVSGQIDQAAGLVWRYRNANNYYVVRANALEDNVVLYKMENGKRSDLKPVGSSLFAYGKSSAVPAGQWNTLRVAVKDDKFTVYLNDKHLFDVEDGTFRNAGKVGLWTKADSVTEFDEFMIKGFDAE